MMNYVWGGLILISFLFAIGSDIRDSVRDRFRNGVPLPAQIERTAEGALFLRIDRATLASHYRIPEASSDVRVPIDLTNIDGAVELKTTASLPEPLATIRSASGAEALRVRVDVDPALLGSVGIVEARLNMPKTRLVKVNAVTKAAIEFAQTAFEVVLKLVGGLCLWLGLLKIAEDAGLVAALNHVTQPILRRIFPDIPRDHPALALISLSVAANLLSLGNAATPLGIRAMQQLQTLNPKPDTASNPMVMLLAINTAGVTLVPSAAVVALLGLRVNDIIFPTLLTTAVSLIVAIVVCRLLGKLKMYRVDTNT